MSKRPIRQHSRLEVALVLIGWLAALIVLVALSPENLKVIAPMLFGAPSFAFILRNYVNWPPKEPFQFGPGKWKQG